METILRATLGPYFLTTYLSIPEHYFESFIKIDYLIKKL